MLKPVHLVGSIPLDNAEYLETEYQECLTVRLVCVVTGYTGKKICLALTLQFM